MTSIRLMQDEKRNELIDAYRIRAGIVDRGDSALGIKIGLSPNESIDILEHAAEALEIIRDVVALVEELKSVERSGAGIVSHAFADEVSRALKGHR